MDFFINDTNIRIEHTKKELALAKSAREKKVLQKKIEDLELLSEVLQEIKDRNKSPEITLNK